MFLSVPAASLPLLKPSTNGTVHSSIEQVKRETLPSIRFHFPLEGVAKDVDTHATSKDSGTAYACRSGSVFPKLPPSDCTISTFVRSPNDSSHYATRSLARDNSDSFVHRLHQDMSRTIPLPRLLNSSIRISRTSCPISPVHFLILPDHLDNRS